MGRHPRIEGKALVYYVSSRGRKGQEIFKNDQDKIYFINLLKEQRIKSKLTFFGYVLLPDLYACLLQTYKNNFIHSLHRINSGYANYLTRRYHYKNKLFHDRYKGYIIEKKNYLALVSRYLHLLPVKAGLVRSPIYYTWSSFPGYVYKNKKEKWITYSAILATFKEENKKAGLSYKRYVNKGIREGISSPFKDLKDSIVLGSEDFKRKIYKNHRSNEIASQKEEIALAKKIIESVYQDSSWASLRIKRRRIDSVCLVRNAAIYFIKKFTDLDNVEISRLFRTLKKTSISQMSRRFMLTKEKNSSLKKTFDALELKINTFTLNKKW